MKIHKVLLIHSAHHAENGKLVKAQSFVDRLTIANVAELGLPMIASYTPAHIKIEKLEDYFDDITFDTDAEVIGISAQVMHLSRALELAKEFKKRGKIVVMGGFLPTMHPEAVIDHVDAICQGEGDTIWPQMLQDIENGCLQKLYKAKHSMALDKIPTPRYDLIKKDRLVIYPVQATRGCPFTCDYCCIIQFYDKTYRYRPVDDIIRDIKATGSKNIYFTDDNLMENPKFCKELFRKMIPLGVIWGTQSTVNVAKDKELLDLAHQSGCRYIAVGVESLSQKNLTGVSKGFNHVEKFEEIFKTIQDAGIGVHALIVFGFPEDNQQSFDDTIDFLEKCGVAIAEFFIFTPYPKTPAGKRVLDAGMIIDTDLNHYRETYVVFKHPILSAEEIVAGYWHAMTRFYSVTSILRRVWRGSFKNKIYHLFSNLYYYMKIKRGIVPVYFGKGNDDAESKRNSERERVFVSEGSLSASREVSGQ